MAKRKTIQELNAFATAYGEAIGRREYMSNVLLPGLVCSVLGMITLEWWVPMVMFAIGAFYGYRRILPRDVERNYWLASVAERGRFMSVATQIATNNEKTMLMVLRESTQRLNSEGELYKELIQLSSRLNLMDVSPESIRPEFQRLMKKYNDDVNFTLFLEQIETGIINGNSNAESLLEIERYHREMRDITNEFMKAKDVRKTDLKTVMGISWIVIGLFITTIGLGEYLRLMHTYYIGMVANAIFILTQLLLINRFNRFYWDDDVSSIGDPKNRDKRKQKEEVAKEDQAILAEQKKQSKRTKNKKAVKKEIKHIDVSVEQEKELQQETVDALIKQAKEAKKKAKVAKREAKSTNKVQQKAVAK